MIPQTVIQPPSIPSDAPRRPTSGGEHSAIHNTETFHGHVVAKIKGAESTASKLPSALPSHQTASIFEPTSLSERNLTQQSGKASEIAGKIQIGDLDQIKDRHNQLAYEASLQLPKQENPSLIKRILEKSPDLTEESLVGDPLLQHVLARHLNILPNRLIAKFDLFDHIVPLPGGNLATVQKSDQNNINIINAGSAIHDHLTPEQDDTSHSNPAALNQKEEATVANRTELSTLRCLNTLQGHTSDINSLISIPGGRLVSCSEDHTLRVWQENENGWVCSSILEGHSQKVTNVISLSDNVLVSASSDGYLIVWDLEKSPMEEKKFTLGDVNHSAFRMEKITDNRFLFLLSEQQEGCLIVKKTTLQIWDLQAEKQPIANIKFNCSPVIRHTKVLSKDMITFSLNDFTVHTLDISALQSTGNSTLKPESLGKHERGMMVGLRRLSDTKFATIGATRFQVWDLSLPDTDKCEQVLFCDEDNNLKYTHRHHNKEEKCSHDTKYTNVLLHDYSLMTDGRFFMNTVTKTQTHLLVWNPNHSTECVTKIDEINFGEAAFSPRALPDGRLLVNDKEYTHLFDY